MLVNGRAADTLPAADRGLHYGDGLFETIAVVQGRPALWQRHMKRLGSGCRRLGLPPPPSRRLAEEAEQLCEGVSRGVLKLVMTRGVGGRGYAPPAAAKPNRILSMHPYPNYPASFWREGVAVRVCRTRLAHQPLLAGLKHLNRLEQVLARAEWDDPAIPEGLMLSENDEIVEGTMSNLFAVIDGEAHTPALDQAGVAGVMRGRVGEYLAEAGLAVAERRLTLADLERAEEVFLTNSVIGVWPVSVLAGRRLGRPEHARRLQAALVAEGAVPALEVGS